MCRYIKSSQKRFFKYRLACVCKDTLSRINISFQGISICVYADDHVCNASSNMEQHQNKIKNQAMEIFTTSRNGDT